MARPIAKVLIVFGVLAVLLLLGAVLVTVFAPRPVAVPLPVPNGYDDFVKAGKLVCDETADHLEMGEEKLRVTVAKNAEALRFARVGLGRECRVPLDYAATNMSGHLDDLAMLKRLARAFAAEGRLAELENRPGDAAESYLNTIRLGQECSRGGVIIDSLVGVASEAIGLTPLEKLSANLDAEHCRAIAAALETAEAKRESAAAVLQQERVWARQTYGLKVEFLRLVTFRQMQATRQKYVGRITNTQTRTRRLSIALAARAYEMEHGARPKSVGDLVPGYLNSTPQDPVTGHAMNYSP